MATDDSSNGNISNESNKPNNKRSLDQMDSPKLKEPQPKKQKLIALNRSKTIDPSNTNKCGICLAKSKELDPLFKQFTWDGAHLKVFDKLLYETRYKYQFFFINSKENGLKTLTSTIRLFSAQFKYPILFFTYKTTISDCFYKNLNYKSYYSISNFEEFNQFLIEIKHAIDAGLGIYILLPEQDLLNSATTLSTDNIEQFSKLLTKPNNKNYNFNNIKWAIQKTIMGPYNLLSSNEEYLNWGILTWLLKEWLDIPDTNFINILFNNLNTIFPKIKKNYVPIIWYIVEDNVDTIYFVMPKKTVKSANTFSNFIEILYKKQSFRAINKNLVYDPNPECYTKVYHILSKYTSSHTQQTTCNTSGDYDGESRDYDSKNAEIDKYGIDEISYEKLEDYFELIENQFTTSISAVTCSRYVEYGFCVNVIKEITMKIHKYQQLGDSIQPITNYNKFIICGDNSNFFTLSNSNSENLEEICWWIPKNMFQFFFCERDINSLSLAMTLILKMIKVSDFLLGIILYGQSKESLRNTYLELAFSKLRTEYVWIYNYSNFVLKTTRDNLRYYISNTDTKLLNKFKQNEMPERTMLLENSKSYFVSPLFIPEIIPTMLTDFVIVLNTYFGNTQNIINQPKIQIHDIYAELLKTSLEIYGIRELKFRGQIQNKKISNLSNNSFLPKWTLTNKRLYYESYNKFGNEWRFYDGISDNGTVCKSTYMDDNEFILLKYDSNNEVEKYKITQPTLTLLLPTPTTNGSDHSTVGNLSKVKMLDNFFNQWIYEEPDKKLISEILSLSFSVGFVLKNEFQKSTSGKRTHIHSINLVDTQHIDYYYVGYDSGNKERTMFTSSGNKIHYNEKMIINNEMVDITIENACIGKIYDWIHPIPGEYDPLTTKQQDTLKKKLLENTCCPAFNMQMFAKLLYKKIKNQKCCNLISTMLDLLSELGNEEYYYTIYDELEIICKKDGRIEEYECYNRSQFQFYLIVEARIKEYAIEKRNRKNLIYSNSDNTNTNVNNRERPNISKFNLKIFPNIPTTVVNTIYHHDFKEGGLCEFEKRQLIFVFGRNTISNILDELFLPNGLIFIREYSTKKIPENPTFDSLKISNGPKYFNTAFYVLSFDFSSNLRSAHNFRLIVTKESDPSTTPNVTRLEILTISLTERIFNKLLSNGYITLTQENW